VQMPALRDPGEEGGNAKLIELGQASLGQAHQAGLVDPDPREAVDMQLLEIFTTCRPA
jgi:hypothetical protein